METNDVVVLILGAVYWFSVGQLEASGSIGNRSYSIWYNTHFLIEKKGVCKLIYYKPKHFDRYTLYEVIAFFTSYVSIPLFAVLGIFRYFDLISTRGIFAIVFASTALILLSQLLIVTVNDVGSYRDKKKKFYLENGERAVAPPLPDMLPDGNTLTSKVMKLYFDNRNNPYYTLHNLKDSYHVRLKEAKGDPQKIDKVNLDYIEYFKNIERLVVIKENKNGSLQLKIKE